MTRHLATGLRDRAIRSYVSKWTNYDLADPPATAGGSLCKKSKSSSLPPLRHNNEWILDAKTKANVLAEVWLQKSTLPADIVDCIFSSSPEEECNQFIPIIIAIPIVVPR